MTIERTTALVLLPIALLAQPADTGRQARHEAACASLVARLEKIQQGADERQVVEAIGNPREVKKRKGFVEWKFLNEEKTCGATLRLESGRVTKKSHGITWRIGLAESLQNVNAAMKPVATSIAPTSAMDAPWDPHLEHDATLRRIATRMQTGRWPTPPIVVRIITNNQPNASASLGSARQGSAIVNLHHVMFDFVGGEGELASVIAHEVGHTVDFRSERQIASSGILEALSGVWRSQNREMAADCLSVLYLVGSGYNALDAGAVEGRLMMYSGSASLGGILFAFIQDHPHGLDRIQTMRRCAEWATAQLGPMSPRRQ